MTKVVAYHGTWHAFDRFEMTRDVGFHFGCHRQACRRIDMAATEDARAKAAVRAGARPRVIRAEIELRNPLVTLDDPMRWDGFHVLSMLRPVVGEERFAQARRYYAARRAERMDESAFVPMMVKRLVEAAGHDGIVYRNIFEGSSRNARGRTDWSYVVVDPGAIRILDADFKGPAGAAPTPDAILAREAEVANWRLRNCKLRFKSAKDAFEAACLGIAGTFGDARLRSGDTIFGRRIEGHVAAVGGEVRFVADVEHGHLTFVLPEGMEAAAAGIFGDLNPVDRAGPRSVELHWQGTETIAEFASRAGSLADAIRTALGATAVDAFRMAG